MTLWGRFTTDWKCDLSLTADMSTLITVTGLQKNFSNEDIELYFETQKSGGSNGCVKKCIIDRDGVAIIEFNSPEGIYVCSIA